MSENNISSEEINNSVPEKPASGRGRAGVTISVVSLLIVALAAVAAWFLFFRGGDDNDERAAYDAINRYSQTHQLDSLATALNDYFDTYNSDAYHYSQLKELNDRFFGERADWQALEGAMSVDAIRHFLDEHPDGFYRKMADEKLDSLVFAEAVDANTREAFEQYLSQFAGGRYAEDAQKKIEDFDKQDLTVDEKFRALETLNDHFDALAGNDKGRLSATLASKINSYIGKSDATEEDIYAYMEHMHTAGRFIVFLVKDAQVAKVDAAGRNMYNVQFALDEETYSSSAISASQHDTEDEKAEEQPKPTSVKHFTGTAVLNDAMKITSLVLRQ
ncbi:MAG: hypothetical protein IJ635_06430 [Bacteroidaceae bacterium]|nr:hypothetical protein [Bacteroidaceae bacterium]